MAGRGITKWDIQNFRELLYISGLRGYDGTGVASIDSGNNTIKIKKDVYPASYFLGADTHSKKPLIESLQPTVYMGHVRSATTGSITQANTHPFSTGRYVSAHNGTLVDLEYNDKDSKLTDSEQMFQSMEKKGIIDTLKDLDMKSAYAVSIYDRQTRTLNLATNGQRPLAFAFLKSRSVMYWASEFLMLALILKRNQDAYDAFTLNPDELYTIKPGSISFARAPEDNYEVSEIPKKKFFSMSKSVDMTADKDWWESKNLLEFCAECGVSLTDAEMFRCAECRVKKQNIHDVQSSDARQ